MGFFSAPYGEYWRFVKRLYVAELRSARQIERSRSVRREELIGFSRMMFDMAEKGKVVDRGAELRKLTNNTICRLLMSSKCSQEDHEAEQIRGLVKENTEAALKLSFRDFMEPFKRVAFWLYGKKAIDLNNRCDDLLEKILMWHEEDREREEADLMDILLKMSQDEKAEIKISRLHIKAPILDLCVGGTGTSTDAMQWVLAELINHPASFMKVRKEIESVVGTTRLVDESDITILPYLQAVVKETLRLYPPVPVLMRETTHHCKIRGFDIPEKSAVAINLYAIMRDPDSWDDPKEFRTERFLETDYNRNRNDQMLHRHYSFAPFGGGRRLCPGMNLAYTMIHSTIASVVQCFDREADGGIVDMKIAEGMSLSISMAHPLLCRPVIHSYPFAA